MKFGKMGMSDLAKAIQAPLEGDGAQFITGLAAPERAGEHDLIYVESPKHADRALNSRSLCVVAPKGIPLPGKTVLRSEKPKVAFAHCAALLAIPDRLEAEIHPTAIIAPDAKIGGYVKIGPYAVIGKEVKIGDATHIGAHCVVGAGSWIGSACRLHPRVTLYENVRLGNNVQIHAGAVIGSDGFGYAFDGEKYWKFPQAGLVVIADDVEIGSNTTIDRGSLDDTRIGEGVKLDNLVHVGHNVQVGAHTVIAAQTGISGSSKLGHHVVVGGQVGIADHCTLEDGCVAGAQAGIPTGKIIRKGQTVWGTPARPLEQFKEAYFWFARLPELAQRVKKLENGK